MSVMDYDAELQRYHEVLRQAWDIRADDHVLDIGCGAGQTTRDAARLAPAGHVLGVDTRTVERADGNIAFVRADAQVYRFPADHFDVAISRFGTMFFADPVAAFTNIRRALRPGGRLVMLVWQAPERNEWDVEIHRALDARQQRSAAFSLADPPFVEAILTAAGFADIALTGVEQPVYYGPDVNAALEWVSGFASTKGLLMTPQLAETMAAHRGADGVWFDSAAWLVTACRAERHERA